MACLLGLLGLRVSEACRIDIENLGSERGHRTVTVLGKGSKLAVIPLPPRVGRAIDLAAAERISVRSFSPGRENASTATGPRGSSGEWLARPGSPSTSLRTHSGTVSSPPHSTPVPLRDVQIAARHADPRTTTRYDRARNNLDRHASYVVTAFVAGAA